jgi:hypothetical protein
MLFEDRLSLGATLPHVTDDPVAADQWIESKRPTPFRGNVCQSTPFSKEMAFKISTLYALPGRELGEMTQPGRVLAEWPCRGGVGGERRLPRNARKPGPDLDFRRSLPEIRCLSPVCPTASALDSSSAPNRLSNPPSGA